MTVIKQEDLVESVAAALQYISYYHPVDYIRHLARAYDREQSPAARDANAPILPNSRMVADGRRPLCQAPGTVNVYLQGGKGVRWPGFTGSPPAPVQVRGGCRARQPGTRGGGVWC